MLNRTALKQIEGTLDKTELTSSSYRIATYDSDPDAAIEHPFLIIEFKDNEEYRFTVTEHQYIDGESGYPYGFEMTPGFFRQTEWRDGNFDELDDLLVRWSEVVKQELLYDSPLYANFEKFKKTIDARIEEHLNDGQSHFNDGEKETLLAGLKELQQRFQELSDKQEITEAELARVSEELSTLSQNINTLPKKTWIRAAATRIFDLTTTIATSKAGQAILEKGAERLLEPPK